MRDSHGLFDYESFQLTKNTLKTENSCIIVRCGTDVRLMSEPEFAQAENFPSPDKIDKLGVVKCENGIDRLRNKTLGKYYIESSSDKPIYDAQLDKLWLIVRPKKTQALKRMPHETYNAPEITLKRGDVIKLGRIAFRIKDYHIEGVAGLLEPEAPYQDSHFDEQSSKCVPSYNWCHNF